LANEGGPRRADRGGRRGGKTETSLYYEELQKNTQKGELGVGKTTSKKQVYIPYVFLVIVKGARVKKTKKKRENLARGMLSIIGGPLSAVGG